MLRAMGKLHQAAIVTFPFLLSLGVACSSDSGGGGCQNLAGTFHATTTSCDSSGDTKVAQTGCSATITTGTGDTVTGTVAGNKFTSPDVSCTVTISGASYITDCTQKDATGKPVTCHDTGTVSERPAQSGAGGAGTTGTGGTGNTATGGAGNTATGGKTNAGSSGGSGTGTAQCGVSWSDVAACDNCMTTSCCDELKNCGPGTACSSFLDCVSNNCTAADATCFQKTCATEFQAATTDVSALNDCNTQQCQGCQ
jgi:hypothetical protein